MPVPCWLNGWRRNAAERVLVLLDRRPHIDDNAFDHYNDADLLVHRYGPHIFHTNSDMILAYLPQFTGRLPYEHPVLGNVDGMLVPTPTSIRSTGCMSLI